MYNPDVVIVTETWLRQDIADSEIIPPPIKLFVRIVKLVVVE